MRDSNPTSEFDLIGRRVWVAGHRGMVGSAVARRLAAEPCEVLTVDRTDVDLRRQDAVEAWMAREKPDAVVLAAAKVGGIVANDTYPAEFIHDNLAIELAIIEAAHRHSVKKLLFLGSSCIYPKMAPQPITEDALMTGPLEPTNEWYAIAKIAGLKMCQAYRRQHGCDFISGMPANLYGIGDNFDPVNSHVVPALMSRIHNAKMEVRDTVTIWGTGEPRREFLFTDDLADACVFMLKHYSGEVALNIGTGTDVTINQLAHEIARVVGWTGRFVHETSRPDGAPRKLLDVSRLEGLGWTAKMPLSEGLVRTYDWFLDALERGEIRNFSGR